MCASSLFVYLCVRLSVCFFVCGFALVVYVSRVDCYACCIAFVCLCSFVHLFVRSFFLVPAPGVFVFVFCLFVSLFVRWFAYLLLFVVSVLVYFACVFCVYLFFLRLLLCLFVFSCVFLCSFVFVFVFSCLRVHRTFFLRWLV